MVDVLDSESSGTVNKVCGCCDIFRPWGCGDYNVISPSHLIVGFIKTLTALLPYLALDIDGVEPGTGGGVILGGAGTFRPWRLITLPSSGSFTSPDHKK